MFEFRRNQVIVTVLVFMIAIAAYLQLKEPELSVAPQIVDNSVGTNDVAVNEIEEMGDIDFFEQFLTDGTGAIETLAPDVDEEMIEESKEVAVNTDPLAETQVVITKQNPTNLLDGNQDKNVEVSYFVEEKMLREQSRASEIERLTECVINESIDADTKAKAAESLILINERIEKESGAESLLRAKGFKDVFVRMDEKSVDVVINKSALTDEEVAQIEEIVQRKTGYSVAQIKIHMNTESANN
ncbi:MAG: SpoIIIAH-like family protein [Cellulosilyticaceae bacterium]